MVFEQVPQYLPLIRQFEDTSACSNLDLIKLMDKYCKGLRCLNI